MTQRDITRRTLLWSGASAALLNGRSFSQSQTGSGPLRVDHLRCEYAENPIGIDVGSPRLSWRLNSKERGKKQSAYRIEAIDEDTPDRRVIWDTRKVFSDECIQIVYAGQPLRSRGRYSWIVNVWDQNDQAVQSERAFWEMGFLARDDWKAKWIGFPAGRNGRALYFRKEFEIRQPIRSARAYVVGLGYYQLRLNGKKMGDAVLDPAFTDYEKRVLYRTFDVTDALTQGGNAIGAIVGNGWYGTPKWLCQLEVRLADGTMQEVITSHDTNHDMVWRVSSGPITANSIYDGEQYDARLEKTGWDSFAMTDEKDLPRTEGWMTANAVSAPGGRLVAAALEPIRVVNEFHPTARTSPATGVFVFDTGQNLAGWIALRVKGKRGDTITLKFAETLLPNGLVNQANLRTAAATDQYICKGEGTESWEPIFTYHGFRYVQVEGYPGEPSLSDLHVRVVRSAVEANGDFSSADALLNRIHKMVWWTENSNLYSIPTDCPQRDERMGWMNDLTVRLEESIYNFQLARFYNNFVDDVADGQNEAGAIGDTVPLRWGTQPADPVSASYLLLGWFLYQHYGDKRALSSHFEPFRRWIDYLHSQSEGNIMTYGYYGDWSPPAQFGVTEGSPFARDTPRTYMSTGYLYYCAKMLAEMAVILEKPREEQVYRSLAEGVRAAFEKKYWNQEKGGYCSNNQACNSFALFLGIVPEKNIARVVDNLVADVKAQSTHLNTGNLCTKYVMEMLSEHGQHDLAFALATQRSYPSWGYMLDNGATTLWERWENMTGGQMNSHNHPMFGSIGSWFYKYLAGIRIAPNGAGGKRMLIRPMIPAELDSAAGSYTTMYGKVRSAWRKEGARLTMDVTIPANSSASVYIPLGRMGAIRESDQHLESAAGIVRVTREAREVIAAVESGSYHFTSE